MKQNAKCPCRLKWLLFQIKKHLFKKKNITLQQKPAEGLQGAEQGLNQQFNVQVKFETKSLRCLGDCGSEKCELTLSPFVCLLHVHTFMSDVCVFDVRDTRQM